MKKFIILMFIVLLSSFVAASTSYKINDVKCFGEMLIQINNATGDRNYTVSNCDMYSTNNYKCKCQNVPEFSNKFSNNSSMNYTSIMIRLQYYIKAVIGDDVIDQQNKRIETKVIYLSATDDSFLNQFINNNSIDVVSFIMWFLFIILLTGVFVSLFFLVLFMNVNKIKRWLGVDEKKPMTFWEVIGAIFSRKSIERKALAPERKQQMKIKPVQETTSNSYEDEVRKLMKDL